VPLGHKFCDHLEEMLVPVSALGSRYLLHSFQGRNNGAFWRVVPARPGSTINYGEGLFPIRLGNLPFHEFKVEQLRTGIISSGTLLVEAGEEASDNWRVMRLDLVCGL
jgi:hypothetical protein